MAGYDSAIGAGIVGTVGLLQFGIAMDQARQDAKKAEEQFADSSAFKMSIRRASEMAKRGFTQDEVNAYLGNQARINNTRFAKGVQAGGNNFANTVQQGINYGNMNAILDFAAKDAALKRSNIQYEDSFRRDQQKRADMNTQRQMQLRDQKRAAIAQLANAGVQNFTTSGAMIAGSGLMTSGTGADSTTTTDPQRGQTGIGTTSNIPQTFDPYMQPQQGSNMVGFSNDPYTFDPYAQPQRGAIRYNPTLGYASQDSNNFGFGEYKTQ